MIGDIMTISRLRMGTDGEGITTLVTFFGCPLHCIYCMNDFCHEPKEKDFFAQTPRGAYEAKELVEKLNRDELYYLMTNGGVTFGGGEPLLQADFIGEVCTLANPDWSYRIETSLYSPWDNIQKLIPFMDEWIIDIKEIDPEKYMSYTGKSNKLVLGNLTELLKAVPADKVKIRIPCIPGINTDDDVQYSINKLKEMGCTRIEEFDYLVLSEV